MIISYDFKKLKMQQSVPKTFWQTSLNSILEEFFLFDKGNFIQFLLDWGLGIVVFGTDCSLTSIYFELFTIFEGKPHDIFLL